ncbi:MAG: alpha/beta fold hydrolase [Xanthobacteraceae bacterium]
MPEGQDAPASAVDAVEPRSLFVNAPDGRKLHVRSYGERGVNTLPAVCLPGLARTGLDFDPLARALAGRPEHQRLVLALDYRGRGRSEYDPDPRNYNVAVEIADLRAVLTACGVERAVFIGTSRGGILTMLLAASHKAVFGGAILNDIGPLIETEGVMRIKSYVGKLPRPDSFAAGAEILRALFGAQFPRLTGRDWLTGAQRMWEKRNGALVPTYDEKLSTTLDDVGLDNPLPPLWDQFDALAGVPLLVIRGVNSDILSEVTVAAMRARRPDLALIEVPDQGHPPLLAEPDVIDRIAGFLADCDAACQRVRI